MNRTALAIFGLSILFLTLGVFSWAENKPATSIPEPVEMTDPVGSETPITKVAPVFDPETPAGELQAFAVWLETNQAAGFVGEVGWPNSGNYAAEALDWLTAATAADIPFTAWAAGHKWPADYPILMLGDTAADSDTALDYQAPQFAAIVAQTATAADYQWGVNFAGLEFSTGAGFSAADSGAYGIDYFDEVEASYQFASESDVDLIRLPFNWERLQPELYGDLDAEYLSRIIQAVDFAARHDLQVILDLHNYGEYKPSTESTLLLGSTLETDALSDVWVRIHAAFSGYDNIYGYGLMNEPRGLLDNDSDLRASALVWEQASQLTLDALRQNDYQGQVVVSGYNWSKLQRWTESHPTGWINDPLDNFIYEAHHYWDDDESGQYRDA